MRYPVISIILVGGLMVWASVNYFGINTGFNGVETFPEDSHTREAFTALEEDFPLGYGSANPARVVIEGDINDPAVAAAVQTFKRSVVGDPAVTEALQKIQQAVESDPALIAALLQSNPEILNDPSAAALPTNTHGNLTVIAIPVPGAPSSVDAFDLIERLRDDYIPAAFSGVQAEAHVGGLSAEFLDFDTQLSAYLPHHFRVHPRREFHPAVGGLPLHRHPHQGDHHEPALRGRCLRADGAGISEGCRGGPVRGSSRLRR